MKLQIFQTDAEVGREAALFLKNLAQKNEGRLRCFLPTGATPKPLYAELRRDASFWTSKLAITQIDDYEAGSVHGVFRREIENEIVKPLKLEKYFSPVPLELQEFLAHAQKVSETLPQVAVLGLGPNGHVGFHEPHLPGDFSFGRVELGEATKKHLLAYNQKLGEPRFDASLSVSAFSFGVGTFQKCETLLMLVTGKSKKDVLEKLLRSQPTASLPASLLMKHPNLHIFADRAAAFAG